MPLKRPEASQPSSRLTSAASSASQPLRNAPRSGEMLAEKFRLFPALAFYALYAAGLVIFAVSPGLGEGGWKTAVLFGALFGLFAYGTYDLTNYATLKQWGLKITLIDLQCPSRKPLGEVGGSKAVLGIVAVGFTA